MCLFVRDSKGVYICSEVQQLAFRSRSFGVNLHQLCHPYILLWVIHNKVICSLCHAGLVIL